MRRLSYLFINLLLLLLVCKASLATAAAAAQFDEEIVVTATKIPQTIAEAPGLVQMIDEETIAVDPNKSVAELLIQQGFTVSTNGGEAFQATIRLDGTSAEQTLIMIDGIPISGGTMVLLT